MSFATKARWIVRPGRNPLARASDRTERRLLLVLLGVVLLAALPAGLLGARTYGQEREQMRTEQATRHPATATLLADVPPRTAGPNGSAGRPARVEAIWQGPDGRAVTGEVTAARGAEAGDVVTVWLDRDGEVVTGPITPSVVITNAITLGFASWSGVILLCGTGFWLVRIRLDRRRAADWDEDWRRFDTRSTRS
ncbi:Rv1733c family protein [Amycolatopsis thermoflava]|uniref:Rv1733c family protein n=1 Tax=Amycolatopsis thermoflava TaxID=84480 RepID=UPI00380E888F